MQVSCCTFVIYMFFKVMLVWVMKLILLSLVCLGVFFLCIVKHKARFAEKKTQYLLLNQLALLAKV